MRATFYLYFMSLAPAVLLALNLAILLAEVLR